MKPLLKRYKVAIDLGARKLCLWIAQENKDGVFSHLLGTSHVACEGLWSGRIVNMEKIEESLVSALYEVEKKSKIQIRHGDLVLNNSFFTFDYHQSLCNLETHEVRPRDIATLQNSISQENKTLIRLIPIEFTVDNLQNIQNPIGLKGNFLQGLFYGVWMDNNLHETLMSLFHRYQIHINTIFNSSLTSGWSCLTGEELELGSIICDIGASCTSVGIFYANNLVECFTIPIGGQHVTNDIAKICGLKIDHGERLKILHGASIDTREDHENFIPLFQFDGEDISISRGFLIQIIQKRYENLLQTLKQRLDFSPYFPICHPIIFTGGGSQMPGLREMAQCILERHIRIAKPIALKTGQRSSGGFSAITGVLMNKNSFNNFNKKENVFFSWLRKNYDIIMNR